MYFLKYILDMRFVLFSCTAAVWQFAINEYEMNAHGGSRDQPCYQVWRPYAYPFLSYELQRIPLITIENAYAATAHVPNHVTRQ